jgi:hypothetical protein
MRTLYEPTVLDLILDEKNRANMMGRKIHKILLTEEEWNEVEALVQDGARYEDKTERDMKGALQVYGVTIERDKA